MQFSMLREKMFIKLSPECKGHNWVSGWICPLKWQVSASLTCEFSFACWTFLNQLYFPTARSPAVLSLIMPVLTPALPTLLATQACSLSICLPQQLWTNTSRLDPPTPNPLNLLQSCPTFRGSHNKITQPVARSNSRDPQMPKFLAS